MHAIVDAAGAQLLYEQRGTADPLLLIHGVAGGHVVWASCLNALSAHHRVIAYDRRGYGRSSGPPARELPTHARDAAALLSALDASPAAVVGWSTGGLIALTLAIESPALVSSLVLVEPPFRVSERPPPGPARATGTALALGAEGQGFEGAKVFLRWALGENTFEQLPERLRDAMLANAPALLTELTGQTGEELPDERLKSVTCPVTCLVGDQSNREILDATQRLARLIPHAQTVSIDDAAHAVHLDQPARFVEAVRGAVTQRNGNSTSQASITG